MDFSLTDEQLEFIDSASSFAEKELNDNLIVRDRDGAFPHDCWHKCADFGIQGLLFPTDYGGHGMDVVTTILLMESLGKACRDSGLLFALNAQIWSVQMPIWRFGDERQKQQYLTRLCKGELIGAHAMTEPGSGSDSYALQTTATLDGDHYILNGSKTFVSNAPVADLFVVFATTDTRKGFLGITAFLAEREAPGLTVGKTINKMGLKTSPWSDVYFDDCKIPIESRLGKVGNGASIFEDSMEWERGFILASQVGVMQRQLETCLDYVNVRKQFKQAIGKFQAVANRLAEMKVRLDTARLLIYKLAWMKQQGQDAPMEAAIAKLYVSEAYKQSSLDAVQVHGGYGYTEEFEVERELRDSIASTLYSGTSEIQKNTIARYLGL